MRLGYVFFTVAVALLASCEAASAAISQSSVLHGAMKGPASSDNRFLRSHDTDTTNEERSVAFQKLFDVKKWFGLRRSGTAVSGTVDDFSKATLKKMLKSKDFKAETFKKWDKLKVEDIKLKIGANTLNDKRFAKLFVEYVKLHRNYRRWG